MKFRIESAQIADPEVVWDLCTFQPQHAVGCNPLGGWPWPTSVPCKTYHTFSSPVCNGTVVSGAIAWIFSASCRGVSGKKGGPQNCISVVAHITGWFTLKENNTLHNQQLCFCWCCSIFLLLCLPHNCSFVGGLISWSQLLINSTQRFGSGTDLSSG